MWGNTPALDVIREYYASLEPVRNKDEVTDMEKEDVNILMIGIKDARHIFQTSAHLYQYPAVGHVNWYVHEQNLELMARQMLLMSTALAPPEELGPLEKVLTFMQLYGNSRLPANTAGFLTKRATQFKKIVTEAELMEAHFPVCNLEQLRYKDRDELYDIFSFWSSPTTKVNMPQMWDRRLRNLLKTRYDSRFGVYDWDYHMYLKAKADWHLSLQEYKFWRNTGMAFSWLKDDGILPNLTLLSCIRKISGILTHQGYLNDIVNGPFVTYGFNCQDDDMMRKCNGMFAKRATDLAKRNLTRMFHEMNKREAYVPTDEDELDLGVMQMEIPKEIPKDYTESTSVLDRRVNTDEPLNVLPLPSTTIYYLPVGSLLSLATKPKFQKFFNILVISSGYGLTESAIQNMLGDNAVILLENSYPYTVEPKKDHLHEKTRNVSEHYQKLLCCVPTRTFDPYKESVFSYRVKRD
ncbi:dynein axonemal assembly factor 3 [Anabrus simplex]|uniref:dynein axonemal assembly factor 3 n=1 Tax=Anabrus simplex TaxID=316456 RepID=UPI0034DD0A61